MDRRITVLGHNALADQYRVFEVVAVPWHERHQHVLTQCQFAQVRGSTIGNYVAFGQFVAFFDDGPLVDIRVLIGALVLDEVVDVDSHFTSLCFRIIHANYDAGCINVVDQTSAGRSDHGP